MENEPVVRVTFIKRMMQAGLTYDQALTAYNTLVGTIADGIVNGQKVYLGQVGVLNPTIQPPRTVKMGFERTAAGVKNTKREYHLDTRIKYCFRLFKQFVRTHELNWNC